MFKFNLLSKLWIIGVVISQYVLMTNVQCANFPRPKAIEKDVQFWKAIYSKLSTSQGYIHDNTNLAVIYEKITVPKNLGRKGRSQYTQKFKKKYQKILDKLVKYQRSNKKTMRLTTEEKRVLRLWPRNVSYKTLKKAKKQLRFQLGQADKFKAGLIRSGQWKPYIISILKKLGLPLEIAALPHVESSFNPKAYSKVGAAGMWQFTRSTGRRYMQVDHIMDERLDPFISSRAAARLLKHNYAVTGTWPLALTAYNHGATGMKRAIKQTGTDNIVTILRHYKSRSFGFASRNFYPSFLAAVEISQHPNTYFKGIRLAPPINYEFITLPAYISVQTAIKTLRVDRKILMASNPALRPAIWKGLKYIPKHYQLRIDRSKVPTISNLKKNLADIPRHKRFKKQKADQYHRVTKGQTLSLIASRYGVRMSDLMARNNLRNKHKIRIGQVLTLPQNTLSQKKSQLYQTRGKKIELDDVSKKKMYQVKKGDTLASIARKNSVSVSQLLILNQLVNKHKIYSGQKLVLIKTKKSQ
jgi:membrane-bound lytic murein transglycosylase D